MMNNLLEIMDKDHAVNRKFTCMKKVAAGMPTIVRPSC